MPPDPPDLTAIAVLAEQTADDPLAYAADLVEAVPVLVAYCREVEKDRDDWYAAAKNLRERQVWPAHVEVYVEGQGHRLYRLRAEEPDAGHDPC